MRKLKFSNDAKAEIKANAYEIAKDKSNAARKWKQDIRDKCQSLTTFPEVGDRREFLGPRVRSTYLGNYVILFQWDESTVEILQVVRGGPDFYWLKDS